MMRPLVALLSLLSVPVLADVHVDAFTNLVLGRQAEIGARMFGITAFEGFPAVVADRDYRAAVAALRPGIFRFGGNVAWFAPKEDDPSWYETEEALRQFRETLLFGARYPFGRFPAVYREMGAEAMFSFGDPPPYLRRGGTSHPADFDRWAEHCVGLLSLWKRCDPDLRLVQVWNEPNATWFRDPRTEEEGVTATSLHIEMANKVATAIKQRFPEMQVGGPVLCWPPAWPPAQQGMKPWYTWDMWTVPWLQQTKDTMDFFDFHVYDVSAADFAVQVEMLANQALLTVGRDLPIWITESNTNLTPEEIGDPRAIWLKRLLPYERLLLRGMLPQADKVAGNLYHDLHAKNHTLLPRGADDPDPLYRLLWILRDLRGLRVVADSDDPDLLCYATLEEDRVTVVLFNDSEQDKVVPLTVSMPCGYWTGPTVRGIGEGGEGSCDRIAIEADLARDGNRAGGRVRLPAFATASVSFLLDRFAIPPRSRLVREHFGDRTLQFVTQERPARTAIAVPAAGVSRTRLRLGLLGAEGDERLSLSLNGAELPVRATALQEIELQGGAVQASNVVELSLAQPADNPRLALGFASIVTEVDR